jgi:DNA-binding NarL/FixJ family response regulator
VRRLLLRAACDHTDLDTPPGSLVLDEHDQPAVISAAAEKLLDRLDARTLTAVLAALATAARAHGQAGATVAGSRGLLELHASAAKGTDDGVSVVLSLPRPATLTPLLLDALGLTERERQVVELALTGLARRQIARRLHLEPATIDDHLTAIHAKAGVTSHAELAALIYRRWYEPLRGRHTPSPYGHFLNTQRSTLTGSEAPQRLRTPRIVSR